MDREVCSQCFSPLALCDCFDIFSHARWCNHCNNHVDLRKHHQTCKYAALEKEVKELREENYQMRELLRAAYSPKPWIRK